MKMSRVFSTFLLLFLLVTCSGDRGVTWNSIGIERLSFYAVDATHAHVTFNLSCTSNVLQFLATLNLQSSNGKTVTLLKQQSLPPASTMMVYRRNLPVSPDDTLTFHVTVGGKTLPPRTIKAGKFFSSLSAEEIEAKLGNEEFSRFLNRTY